VDHETPSNKSPLAQRFRGFLPIVIDVETGGFNAKTDALLEIAAITLMMDENGILHPDECYDFHITPFSGANIEKAALEFTGIDLQARTHPTQSEFEAITDLFKPIRRSIKSHGCTRAIVVAHNAHFDLGFLNAVVERCDIKRNPFHPFSCFDTATLAGLAFGQTVLAKACNAAAIDFNNSDAHSAAYDAQKTAELFCSIVNHWQRLGGWRS
jgi:ribonuclease T